MAARTVQAEAWGFPYGVVSGSVRKREVRVPPRQSGKPSSRSKSSAPRKTASTSKSTTRTRKPAATTSSDAPTGEGVREQLQRILNPLELVVLTRDRVQGALDEAVERGRMTRQDASDLASELLSRGRRQTDDLLSELEGLLGRSLGNPADRVIREVDRARRAAGIGPSFPIFGYDDLTAAQVQERLGELSPPELRKVRDYERRNANRKSVLGAIEQKLD
jgi:polyhydroxyalkanoate synthesis regulator phasin